MRVNARKKTKEVISRKNVDILRSYPEKITWILIGVDQNMEATKIQNQLRYIIYSKLRETELNKIGPTCRVLHTIQVSSP